MTAFEDMSVKEQFSVLQSTCLLLTTPGSAAYNAWMLKLGAVLLMPPLVENPNEGRPYPLFLDKDHYGAYPNIVLERLTTEIADSETQILSDNDGETNSVWALCRTTRGLDSKWGRKSQCDYHARVNVIRNLIEDILENHPCSG